MKTAEEWAKGNTASCWDAADGHCPCKEHCEKIATLIRAAQRDAIEAAVEKAKWAVWHKCMVENPVCVCEVNDYPAPCGNSYEEMLDAIRSLLLAP